MCNLANGPRNRSFDSTNPSGSTSLRITVFYASIVESSNLSAKRDSSSGSHQANIMMSAPKRSSAATPQDSGTLGWLSSWLPGAGPAPVQATKKPTPNSPTKGRTTHPGYYLTGIEGRFFLCQLKEFKCRIPCVNLFFFLLIIFG